MHNYGQESEKFVKFQVFKLFDKLNKYNGITLPCVPFFFYSIVDNLLSLRRKIESFFASAVLCSKGTTVYTTKPSERPLKSSSPVRLFS